MRLRHSSVVVILAMLLSCHEEPARPAPRSIVPEPNVVVIVIDTLRADRLPCYGGPSETAPFLASLAEQSLVFDNAWAASSWTAPATASIFTGPLPQRTRRRIQHLLADARACKARSLYRSAAR